MFISLMRQKSLHMDKKLISEAIESLELLDIHLYTSSLKRFEDIDNENYPENMFQQNKVYVNADVLEPESDEDSTRLIIAKVGFGLRFVIENEESEIKNLAEIEACFVAKYHQSKDLSEDAIKEFLKFNAVHNVWPFWREFAFSSASQSKLPTPMISLLKKNTDDN